MKNTIKQRCHAELDSASSTHFVLQRQQQRRAWKIPYQVRDDRPLLNNNNGFTLIELLVVVLIIGILAAVALPQYQKAVIKSRYATLKNLMHSIAQAQEIYYLANNQYATDFEELSVEMPAGKLDTSTASVYKYNWGNCRLQAQQQVMCTNNLIGMQYQIYLQNSDFPNLRSCMSFNTDLKDATNQVCKSDTGKNTPGGIYDTYVMWTYPR